ncbi:macrophage mannose receptor 1-like [Saccostrea echinata]|uniref:macrophage mannose receptor 1-like n=1 Tax=Saccostrea echinata TaxID=191078 RepID=UPI002A824F58|nr:macrophage mannose receptor 1-like [Saccostrea echinata]
MLYFVVSVLSFCAVVYAQPPPVDANGCPAGFKPHGGYCYFASRTEANWAGAMGYCQSIGANLATVKDLDTQTFLTALIKKNFTTSTITLNTGNDYIYHYLIDSGIDVSGHFSFTFDVMACNDAHIALSRDKNDNAYTYEIVIGGWSDSQSVIRDCKQCAHMDTAAHQNHPVNCTQYLPFWISWTNNVIKVGKGHDIGKNRFLIWNDTAPHDVNFVAVATGFGATGKWKFERGTYMPGQFWLAGSDLALEQQWMWLPDETAFDYTNWASGEPDNLYNKQHCILMDSSRSYQWTDEDCEESRNFICQIERNG